MIKNKLTKFLKYIENNKFTISLFFIIFLLLGVQHSVIGMYFDDYGNASLSYGIDIKGVIGTNYNLAQLFEWANFIYFNWGGRILYAICFIIPLLRIDITAYMFVQTFVITGIIYFIYLIIKKYLTPTLRKMSCLIPIILFILYTCIDMYYLKHGIYWASASILYVWPILPLLVFIYLYSKICEKIKNNEKVRYYLYLPILFLLIILITLSQEQIGIALIAFLGSYIVFNHFKSFKKYLKLDIFCLLTSIISYLVLFLAPGNWVRMDQNVEFDNLSFFGKILQNYPRIMHDLFLNKMNIFTIVLCIILMYIIFKLISENLKKNKKYYLFIICAVINIIQIILMLTYTYNIFFVLNSTLWLISMFICSLFYFIKNKKLEICSIEISAVASVFCLLMSPVTGGRTCIPFIFMIFIIIGYFFIELLNNKNRIIKVFTILIIVGMGLIGTVKYAINYVGYRDNYTIYKLNDSILSSYENNEKVIKLYKYKNDWFASTLPYEEPSMNYWIKQYYDIDYDVEFEWIDIYEEYR